MIGREADLTRGVEKSGRKNTGRPFGLRNATKTSRNLPIKSGRIYQSNEDTWPDIESPRSVKLGKEDASDVESFLAGRVESSTRHSWIGSIKDREQTFPNVIAN
jgi:hypothetical protein